MGIEKELWESERMEAAREKGYFEFNKPEGRSDEEESRIGMNARRAARYNQAIMNNENGGAGHVLFSDYPLSFRIAEFKFWIKDKYIEFLNYFKK